MAGRGVRDAGRELMIVMAEWPRVPIHAHHVPILKEIGSRKFIVCCRFD